MRPMRPGLGHSLIPLVLWVTYGSLPLALTRAATAASWNPTLDPRAIRSPSTGFTHALSGRTPRPEEQAAADPWRSLPRAAATAARAAAPRGAPPPAMRRLWRRPRPERDVGQRRMRNAPSAPLAPATALPVATDRCCTPAAGRRRASLLLALLGPAVRTASVDPTLPAVAG